MLLCCVVLQKPVYLGERADTTFFSLCTTWCHSKCLRAETGGELFTLHIVSKIVCIFLFCQLRASKISVEP